MAHRIQENVSQPKIMTGGQLKDYQVSMIMRVCAYKHDTHALISLGQRITVDGFLV